MTPFRKVQKEMFQIMVPSRIIDRIRTDAALQRRSISEVGSEILARGLEIDPAEIGIKPVPATST